LRTTIKLKKTLTDVRPWSIIGPDKTRIHDHLRNRKIV